MKRLVSILLMICLVVSLAACGGSGSGKPGIRRRDA